MTLSDFFAEKKRLAIAFSGGLDSRFLCASALKANCDVLAIHIRGPHIPRGESAGARAFAATMELSLEEVAVDPLSVPQIANTDPLRCYYCKRLMLQSLGTVLAHLGEEERILCDGSNADDLSRYRPGLRALQEKGVLSPLALVGLSKADILKRARDMGFPLPKEQARPCLLTRYDYHLPVKRDELARIEETEEALLRLKDEKGNTCFADLRLRLTPSPLLQVTRFLPQWKGMTDKIMAANGFADYAVVETASISGFFDQGKNGADSGKH